MVEDELAIKAFFEEEGFSVEKIPESSEESPDFIVDDGKSRILVELKTKLDSESVIKSREEKLSSGEIYEKVSVLGRRNRISGILKKASSQLKSKKEQYEADYCFVFLFATGMHASEKLSQFEASVFGTKDIIHMGGGDPNIKRCYYFGHSDFFNNRDILDGAFTSSDQIARLCINSLSPNYPKILNTKFVRVFQSGVIDPVEQEAHGAAYLLDADISRNDEESLKQYLQAKYNLGQIVPFNWPQISVASRIPIEEN